MVPFRPAHRSAASVFIIPIPALAKFTALYMKGVGIYRERGSFRPMDASLGDVTHNLRDSSLSWALRGGLPGARGGLLSLAAAWGAFRRHVPSLSSATPTACPVLWGRLIDGGDDRRLLSSSPPPSSPKPASGFGRGTYSGISSGADDAFLPSIFTGFVLIVGFWTASERFGGR